MAADRLPDPAKCDRCGSDKWAWRDFRGCSDCLLPNPVSAAVSPSHCGHDPDGFVTAGEGTAHCPSCEWAAVAPAEPPRRRITVTHTRSLTFVQAEVDAVWNSGVLPIPHPEYVRDDDPGARAIAVFEALDGSLLELFLDEGNDDVGYEVEDYDPEA